VRIIVYIGEMLQFSGRWDPPDAGCYVRTQGAGATWQVVKHWRNPAEEQLAIVLDSIDPHEVPLNAPVFELPRAACAEVVPLRQLMEEAGMSGVLADVVGGMDEKLPQIWL
jgi:hypothetical protein